METDWDVMPKSNRMGTASVHLICGMHPVEPRRVAPARLPARRVGVRGVAVRRRDRSWAAAACGGGGDGGVGECCGGARRVARGGNAYCVAHEHDVARRDVDARVLELEVLGSDHIVSRFYVNERIAQQCLKGRRENINGASVPDDGQRGYCENAKRTPSSASA